MFNNSNKWITSLRKSWGVHVKGYELARTPITPTCLESSQCKSAATAADHVHDINRKEIIGVASIHGSAKPLDSQFETVSQECA